MISRGKLYLSSTIIFGIVAILHLGRVLMNYSLTLGSFVVPNWLSIVVGFIALYLSYQSFSYYKRN